MHACQVFYRIFFLDGANSASWAKGLKSKDFRLLCKDGGSAEVDNYKNCHLERVPSHKVFII